MQRRTRDQWIPIIEEAARSGMPVSKYCDVHELSENQFHKMSRLMGYIQNGKRTAKWEAAARGDITPVRESPALVPVPTQTMEKALAVSERPSTQQPQIVIQFEAFRIAVGEDFSKAALLRVMEVIANA